jgi:DNA-binding NarL/FixJ family response regulator
MWRQQFRSARYCGIVNNLYFMRLMIIDDHAGTREMIREVLTLPGIVFCECASGDEALRSAREFKPDWITVDVNLPGRDGFAVTRMLRAEHPLARVIIFTAHKDPHFSELSNSVGATAIIYKDNITTLGALLERKIFSINPSPAVTDAQKEALL